jgi:hypothetical protein
MTKAALAHPLAKAYPLGKASLALSLALCLGALAQGGVPKAWAQEATAVKLILKNHKFQPAQLHAPSGKPISVEISNQDPTPAEFESKTLRVEKVIAGGATVTVQLRALPPGRYRFFDDYHEDTTEGFLVVQ